MSGRCVSVRGNTICPWVIAADQWISRDLELVNKAESSVLDHISLVFSVVTVMGQPSLHALVRRKDLVDRTTTSARPGVTAQAREKFAACLILSEQRPRPSL